MLLAPTEESFVASVELMATADAAPAVTRMSADEALACLCELTPCDPRWADATSPNPPPDALTERDGLLWLGHRVHVPPDPPVRTVMLFQAFDSPLAGHGGRDKTIDRVRAEYWSPGLRRDVASCVRSCDRFQRTEPPCQRATGLLQPLPPPSQPWSHLSLNHIAHLPPSHSCGPILVVAHRFSKMAHFIPIRSND